MTWRGVLTLLCCLACAGRAAHAAKPEIVIDPGGVPPAALQVIVAAVDAIARLAEDQDGGEVSRLRRRAHEATLSALETQGYFNARVTLDAVHDDLGEAWDIAIQPGALTRVGEVDISFQGSIGQPPFSQRVQQLRQDWPLTVGMPFINGTWSDAKADLLGDVRRRDFYFARYTLTQATVHADRDVADLELDVDSGPRVTMGELEVDGLNRVPKSLIERYVRYSPGDPYDQDKLDEWQQALQSTSFFRGAFVALDVPQNQARPPSDGEVELPVRVRVSESPARRVASSLGFDTDNGVRAEAVYRQNIVFGLPVWVETGAGVDKNQQRVFFDWHLAPSLRGYHDSFGVLFSHSDINGLDTQRYGAGWKRKQSRKAAGDSRVEYETQWGLVAAHETNKIDGASQDNYRVPTAVATWQWLRRDVNNKYDPREGNLVDLGLGSGVTLDRGEPFYRASLRAQGWWSFSKRDVLTVRGEIGKVWARTDRVPTDFGYRIGGARTVRGYRYQSLGIDRGDAVIGAPAMIVGGVEYTHYFTDMLGLALFVDAGDAAESYRSMKWAFGYGAGARILTPAGPFEIDLAYAQRDRRLRLNLSLGIAF